MKLFFIIVFGRIFLGLQAHAFNAIDIDILPDLVDQNSNHFIPLLAQQEESLFQDVFGEEPSRGLPSVEEEFPVQEDSLAILPPEVVDNFGNTPLHRAVYDNNLALVLYYILRGDNPNATDLFRVTPLTVARYRFHTFRYTPEANTLFRIINLLEVAIRNRAFMSSL